MGNRLSRIVLAVVLIACAVVYLVTVPSMPDVIASQFRGDGFANAYMTRQFYLLYILVFGIGLPLFLAFMISVLPVMLGRKTGERTMSDEQAKVVLPFGWWIASLTALFAVAIHMLVVKANQLDPQQLANTPFFILLIGFLTVTLLSAAFVVVRVMRLG